MKNLTGWSKDRPDVKSPDRLSAIRPHVGTFLSLSQKWSDYCIGGYYSIIYVS